MNHYVRNFIFLLLITGGVIFGLRSWGEPTALRFDPARLARIDAHFAQAVAEQKIAGGRAVIMQAGQQVYAQNWGYRDLENKTPMTDDAIFQIYSMSKPIVSVAVMMLFEEGRLRLDMPIATYIPELADLKVYDAENGAGNPPLRAAARQPTVHDLLTHRAGMTYGFLDASPVGALYRKNQIDMPPYRSLSEYMQSVAAQPLKFDPGTAWNYSISPDVLGRLVEVVSGQTLGEFLQARIFAPLGMLDTSFKRDPAKADRIAKLYAREGITAQYAIKGFAARPTGSGLELAHPGLQLIHSADAKFESGGGGLLSTTHDYLRFAQMLLNHGELEGVRLLAPNTVAMMRHNQIGDMPALGRRSPTFPGPGVGFGLGFAMITDQALSGTALPEGSYFWGGAAGTFFWVDPKNDLTAIFMMQVLPEDTGFRKDMWSLTYQAISDDRLDP
jgi:CubicO group peptidase (beta-lactamase class C family)